MKNIGWLRTSKEPIHLQRANSFFALFDTVNCLKNLKGSDRSTIGEGLRVSLVHQLFPIFYFSSEFSLFIYLTKYAFQCELQCFFMCYGNFSRVSISPLQQESREAGKAQAHTATALDRRKLS